MSIYLLVAPGKTASNPAESCLWLNQAFYNLKSGKYWVNKKGKSSFEFCEMDDTGIHPEGMLMKVMRCITFAICIVFFRKD